MSGAFCGKCGAPAAGPAAPQSPQAGAPAGLADNAAGALCYLLGLITGVIFLVMAPYNQKPGIRFHAFQSILFNVAWIVMWIAISVLIAALPLGLDVALLGLSSLLSLAFLALWLFLMFRAYQNQPLSLPVIGPIAQNLANKQ
jgi:uncharacterized membrane protein